MFEFPLLRFFLLNFLLIIKTTNANDVLGCGGYVKSEVEIDFSQVRIKLLTQQGNIKYDTECAPNNGYYFIPLYDKGDYILKVSPPAGWSFDPEEVVLKIDGETDPCSQNQDVNFFFKGFAVVGRIITIGSEIGPPGVTVTLYQGKKEVLRSLTSENGDFIFTPLGAGTYDVIASHPRWEVIKNKVTVTVKDGNGDAGSTMMIGGYHLSGSMAVSEEVAEKVKMILHSNQKFTHSIGCEREKLESYRSTLKFPVVCHTSLDKEGRYTFTNIPVGKYLIAPHFLSSVVKYNVDPVVIEVEVGQKDQHVSNTFQLKGRSFHGRVIMSEHSEAIVGAEVTLDKDLKTITDQEGNFAFHNVNFGNHVIKVTAEDVEFDELKFNLNMNTANLLIKPVSYKTCFFVSIDSTSTINIPWTISVIGKKYQHEVHTRSTGSGCVYLKPDEYKASIQITPQDEEAGIRFGPREHVFQIESQPIKELTFSQFLGEIHGVIHCLESCRTLSVSLRPSKGSYGTPRTTTAIQGKFVFKEVVPAEYILSVDKEEWCWKEPIILVSVNTKNVSAKFEQTGFRLTLNASHRTTLNYVTHKGHTGKLEVAEGTSRECVSAPGKYAFTPVSCHRFGSVPLTWDTSSLQLLSIIASHHQVTGILISSEPGPFSITVKSEQNPESVIGPLVPSATDKNIYPFEAWLENGETVTLIPSSSSNLFQYSPSSFTLKVADDCMFSVVQFDAERALFLKGYVKPALKGVTIKVVGEGEELTFTTNAEGFFIAGPLDKSQAYNVIAEKVGYIMKPSSQRVELEGRKVSDIIKMSFEAYKLAEIIVKIIDEKNQPLEGVLVSTSGGKNYRQNSLTEKDGTYTFQSLMPSDYFLRPMMKEYIFDPSSKMVKVEGGATVNVDIKGVRVAYSIFGQTISLSGEPEVEVMIEAVGVKSPCLELQEEALADSQGNFRIRGLTPNCDYKIRLKRGEGINPHVDRSLPKEKIIKIEGDDYKGLKVIVLRPFLQMDVAVIVDTDNQYLPTLSAELYKDENFESPVHRITIGNHPFFMLPPMIMDNKTYTLQLVSSLPHNQYAYSSKSASFVANSSFIKVSLPFKPTFKTVDAEISRGTVFGLLFFVVAVVGALNYNKIQPFVLTAIEMYYSRPSNTNNGNNRPSKLISQAQIPVDSAFIEPVNVRKRVKVRKT